MVSFNKKLLLTFRINLNPSTNQDVATTDFNFVQSPEGGRRKLAALAHLAKMPSHRSCSEVLAGERVHSLLQGFSHTSTRAFLLLLPYATIHLSLPYVSCFVPLKVCKPPTAL